MNVLVLLVLLAGDPGDKRSPTSLYLTHMAMADLLYLVSPFNVKTIYEAIQDNDSACNELKKKTGIYRVGRLLYIPSLHAISELFRIGPDAHSSIN